MINIHKQSGLSFWSLLILIPMVGFYFFLGIKIGPEYMSYMSVKTAVEGVANEERLNAPSRQDLRESINKRIDVSSVYYMKKEYINFKEMEDGLHIITSYSREIPMISNIFVALKFDHDVKVKEHSQQ